MKTFILLIALIQSCASVEYHAASPLMRDISVDKNSIEKYRIAYSCPKADDQLLCTYMENLLDIKGYTFEENDSTDEQAEDDPNKKKLLTLKISSEIVKDYGSGGFDFALWLISLFMWPYEEETFFKVNMEVVAGNKLVEKGSFYANYSKNYSWVYSLTRWTTEKLSKEKEVSTEEAGSKDLYKFFEKTLATGIKRSEMETL